MEDNALFFRARETVSATAQGAKDFTMVRSKTHHLNHGAMCLQNPVASNNAPPASPSCSTSPGKYTVVSFFCGCGGLDLGFRGNFAYHGMEFPESRFTILKAYDNNPKAVQTYNLNVGNHAEVLDLSNYNVEQVPAARVLIGGFPCQDFASCGPRKGLASIRGRLYLAMIKYAERYNPEVVIGENVPGLENIREGQVLDKIKNDLSAAGELGYRVEIWKMYAPDYGVPQSRMRLIIIGVRKDLEGFPVMPVPTFNAGNYRSTRWAIGDLEGIADETVPNQSQYFKASKANRGNGQGDEVSPMDAPSYTIRANAKSRVQFHYRLNRRLTVRECARIQTFPDTFTFPHSATTNIMEIGNAVPPLLGNLVANSVQRFLEDIDNERTNR